MGVKLVIRYTQHAFESGCLFHTGAGSAIQRKYPTPARVRKRNRKISLGMMVLKNERRNSRGNGNASARTGPGFLRERTGATTNMNHRRAGPKEMSEPMYLVVDRINICEISTIYIPAKAT